jgi:hypothetical protein
MRAILTAFALSLVGSLSVTAIPQSPPAPSLLDRIVPGEPNGGPYALTPPLRTWSDRAALSVGRAAGIVVGFEAAPEILHVGDIATPEIAAAIKTRRRVPLAGKTVRDALDTIVAVDPRYRWVDVGGVPVVRPWASWNDPKHPLNQVVAPIAWHETDLATALSNVVALVTGTTISGPIPGSGRGPTFALQTGPIAVMELLNAIGTAHGGAVVWYMRHNCTTKDRGAVYVHAEAHDTTGQVWGLGICRVRNPERGSQESSVR